MITDIANETNQAASVRSIYLALMQLDRSGAGAAETTRAELCALSGVRYTTLDAGLKTLVRAGAIISERIRHRGLDTGLRIKLLSVPVKRAPVPVVGADKSEEGIKKEREEMRETSPAGAAGSVAGKYQTHRPIPSDWEEVVAVAMREGFTRDQGIAYWNVMTERGWTLRGRPVRDWQLACVAWCTKDSTRKLKWDTCTNTQFWEYVRANEYSEEAANDFVRLLKKNGMRLKNRLTGRHEPVQDYRAAFKAFVESDLNQALERCGNR